MREQAIVHLNVIGFKAAVAAAKDNALRGRPLVIAGTAGGRAVALDCSREAVNGGITPGMTLADAEKLVKNLIVLPPDFAAYSAMNTEIEKVISAYAPAWENDCSGNLYLDITGTAGLFGAPADCSSRILREIGERTDLKPAAAVACNKLVSKVATRTIRPAGLIQIQRGTEADFLSRQDVRLLPGMGPGLLRTAAVTGIREIGEIAALSVNQVVSLFGKRGAALRDMALGIDNSGVTRGNAERRINARADFEEDVLDLSVIRGAIEALAEHCGFAMRRDRFGTTVIRLSAAYSDGVNVEKTEKVRRPRVLDRDISAVGESLYRNIASRRIRIRSVGLSLEGLTRLGYEPDLFDIEAETANKNLQEAVDRIQNKFGEGKITRGLVLAASVPPSIRGGRRLLDAGAVKHAN